MVVQSDLGFLEQLLMRSRLDAARDFMISSLAVRHAARYARRSGSALEVFQRRSSLRRYFLASTASGREPILCLSGPGAVTSFEESEIIQNRCYCIFHLLFKTIYSGIGVCEERRCQNRLLKRGKVNVFQVSILIRPTRNSASVP